MAQIEEKNYRQIGCEKLTELYAEHNVSEDFDEKARFLERYLEVSDSEKNYVLNFSGRRDNLAWIKILEKEANYSLPLNRSTPDCK